MRNLTSISGDLACRRTAPPTEFGQRTATRKMGLVTIAYISNSIVHPSCLLIYCWRERERAVELSRTSLFSCGFRCQAFLRPRRRGKSSWKNVGHWQLQRTGGLRLCRGAAGGKEEGREGGGGGRGRSSGGSFQWLPKRRRSRRIQRRRRRRRGSTSRVRIRRSGRGRQEGTGKQQVQVRHGWTHCWNEKR